jgi:hypothetical protein
MKTNLKYIKKSKSLNFQVHELQNRFQSMNSMIRLSCINIFDIFYHEKKNTENLIDFEYLQATILSRTLKVGLIDTIDNQQFANSRTKHRYKKYFQTS